MTGIGFFDLEPGSLYACGAAAPDNSQRGVADRNARYRRNHNQPAYGCRSAYSEDQELQHSRARRRFVSSRSTLAYNIVATHQMVST